MQAVTIYTRPSCGFCARALSILKTKGAPIVEISVAEHPEKREEMLARSNGKPTYPQIFIGDVHIGGCEDLMALDSRGGLDTLLESV